MYIVSKYVTLLLIVALNLVHVFVIIDGGMFFWQTKLITIWICMSTFQVKPIILCITYAQYRDEGKHGHILDKLDPGNYTFRLRATSLAGNGSWTEHLSFKIKDHKSKSAVNQFLSYLYTLLLKVQTNWGWTISVMGSKVRDKHFWVKIVIFVSTKRIFMQIEYSHYKVNLYYN